MSNYVMCLGETRPRRAAVRLLQRSGHTALACDGAEAILAAIRDRGLPHLILSDSAIHVRRAREVAPRLYEVGSLPIELFARADANERKFLLTG